MLNIIEKYGIKEVADVTFYQLNSNDLPGTPMLFLDTLKVSTLEQTAETAVAKGGKGATGLIAWDHSKELTLTIEDALFSMQSLALAMGINPNSNRFDQEEWVTKSVKIDQVKNYNDENKTAFFVIKHQRFPAEEVKFYGEDGAETTFFKAAYAIGKIYKTNTELSITPNCLPGLYYIVGDTYIRSAKTGQDEIFRFIIPKAKLQLNSTITMEADGGPATLSFTLRALRGKDGTLVRLKKYATQEEADGTEPVPTEGLEYVLNPDGISYTVNRGECMETDIVIPKTHNKIPVTKVGSFCLDAWAEEELGQSSITSIFMPNSIIEIQDYAFAYNYELKEITIPRNVQIIGESTFEDTDIEFVEVDNKNLCFSNDKYGVLYTKDKKTLIYFPTASKIISYEVDSATEHINNNAFMGSNVQDIYLERFYNSIPGAPWGAEGAGIHWNEYPEDWE